MRVTIDFYRHGLSCTNAVQHYHWNKLQILWMHDPKLTRKGAEDAKNMSRTLSQPDIVLSSVLFRAIETASLLFHNTSICVAPHIRERAFGTSNAAIPPTKQRARMSSEMQARVNYKFVSADNKAFDHGTQGHDWNHFLVWLERSLPTLCFLNGIHDMHTRTHLHVAIVGHSHFMRDVFSKSKMNKPQHLGCIRLLYDYAEDARLQAVCADPRIEDFRTLTAANAVCPGIVNVGVALPLDTVDLQDC